MSYPKRTPTPKSTTCNATRPSAYQILQQKRVLRRFLRKVGFQHDEIKRSVEKTTWYNLWTQMTASLANVAQLKYWLLERVDCLLLLVKPFKAPKRLSRNEWLALAMVAGLTTSSLSQPLIALAQEPLGDEFQVNTYTSGPQRNPSVGMDADGDFVVVWSGFGLGDSYGIFAQRYNASGTPHGSEFRVNTYTTGVQFFPCVGIDNDGDFVITWTSDDQDGNNYGIYAQRYNTSGTPQGSEFRVNSYTASKEFLSSVGMDADGDFVIAWQSGYPLGQGLDGSNYGIYAQRYNASGTPRVASSGSTLIPLIRKADPALLWMPMVILSLPGVAVTILVQDRTAVATASMPSGTMPAGLHREVSFGSTLRPQTLKVLHLWGWMLKAILSSLG